MDLIFRDIDVRINDTQILKKISGVALRGDILAVMGPSGAGKSTLLEALAGRLPTTSGIITLNGELLNKHLRRKMKFVLQQNVFFPNLTLMQTLTFAALLTLPDKMSHSLKLQRVREIIEILELQKCTDTVMGDAFILGLSGGERKRAAIACEMLIDPDILLIDEPTTGLDYGMAYSLVKMLQKYKHVCRKTLVVSIHQPSSQMFDMFDNLLLLADGELVYLGECSKVLDHFASVGLQCKPHYNPADFIMEQLRTSSDIKKTLIQENWRKRQDTWPTEIKKQFSASNLQIYRKKSSLRESNASHLAGFTNSGFKETPYQSTLGTLTGHKKDYDDHKKGDDENVRPIAQKKLLLVDTDLQISYYIEKNKKWQTGFWTQYRVLTQRVMIYTKKNLFQPINVIYNSFLCLFTSLIWFQLDRSEESLEDRLGAIFFILAFCGSITIISATSVFGEENAVIMRERSAGTYRLSAYWLAKQTSELLVVCIPTLFVGIAYWAIGLNPSAPTFFSFLALTIIYVLAMQGTGLIIGVLLTSQKNAVTVSVVTMIFFYVVGGYTPRHLMKWISWSEYLSPLAYAFQAALILEFRDGPELKCLPGHTTAFEDCLRTSKRTVSGDDILRSLHVTMPIWFYYLILVFFCIASRYAVYLSLRYLRRPNVYM